MSVCVCMCVSVCACVSACVLVCKLKRKRALSLTSAIRVEPSCFASSCRLASYRWGRSGAWRDAARRFEWLQPLHADDVSISRLDARLVPHPPPPPLPPHPSLTYSHSDHNAADWFAWKTVCLPHGAPSPRGPVEAYGPSAPACSCHNIHNSIYTSAQFKAIFCLPPK